MKFLSLIIPKEFCQGFLLDPIFFEKMIEFTYKAAGGWGACARVRPRGGGGGDVTNVAWKAVWLEYLQFWRLQF